MWDAFPVNPGHALLDWSAGQLLVPTFGDLALRDLTPMTLQSYFSKMASSSLAQESKDKIRDVLSRALGSAQLLPWVATHIKRERLGWLKC